MWLDEFIGYFAPRAGKSRLQARIEMGRLRDLDAKLRAYDGAATGRRREGWQPKATSANAEILPAGAKLRDRARDLARNNPYARKGERVYVHHTIGTGITPRPDTGSDRLNRVTARIWDEWSARCFGPAKLNFYGVEALVARTVFKSGEGLVRFRLTEPEDGWRVPVLVQVLEPDHLDASRVFTNTATGNRVVGGIEYDALERPVAYYLWPEHPGDTAGVRVTGQRSSLQSVRVPAEDVLHVYRVERPGQSRGVPELAASMTKMRDLDDYDDAEIVRKQIASCLVGMINTPEGAASPLGGEKSTEDATAATLEKMRAGMLFRGRPGDTITFNSPPSDSGGGAFDTRLLHAIAAGVGVTYEQLTGDLARVNYSSYRAGLIDFRGMVEEDRWNMYVPMLCEPVWRRVMRTAYLAGLLQKPVHRAEWVAPAFQSVDPMKDMEALEKALRLAIKTLPQAIAEQGYNPDDQLAQIAETNKKLDALGIVTDADPRKVGKASTPAKQDDDQKPKEESKDAQE